MTYHDLFIELSKSLGTIFIFMLWSILFLVTFYMFLDISDFVAKIHVALHT